MIDTIIGTPEQKILSLMAMNPGQAFYTRQISRKLGISLGSTHSALQALEKQNMLTSRLDGCLTDGSPRAVGILGEFVNATGRKSHVAADLRFVRHDVLVQLERPVAIMHRGSSPGVAPLDTTGVILGEHSEAPAPWSAAA